MKFFLSLMFASAASASVLQLDQKNYNELTAGKTVFLKFFAPWCGHCKTMAEPWAQLAGEYADSASALIAEVDCTAEGKSLCDEQGVRGFPTIKYGDPSALEDYSGGRDYASLAAFAGENLQARCSPSNLELCDDEMKAKINTLMALPAEELAATISEEEKKLEDAEESFKTEVQKLQDKYQSLMEEKDAAIAAVKAAGLSLMKSVAAASKKVAEGSDEL
jgi:protein disulfide-isomerase-like protein